MYSSGGDSVDSAGPCEVLPSLPAPSWMGYIFNYGNGEAVLCESSQKVIKQGSSRCFFRGRSLSDQQIAIFLLVSLFSRNVE